MGTKDNIHEPSHRGKKRKHKRLANLSDQSSGRKDSQQIALSRPMAIIQKVTKPEADEDESGGSSSGSGSISIGRTSYLVDETAAMARSQRLSEQEGLRRSGVRVNAREHNTEEPAPAAPEGELQNSISQHPLLDGQRFDGIDPGLNPEPPLNTDARREYDNERREQELEKQLRLGNAPQFSPGLKPKGL